jgi:hypothetical protein
VRVDLRLDRAERRVAALVCERGAHCRGGEGQGYGEEKDASGESAAERSCGHHCTLHETDIAVHPREREFPLARGDGRRRRLRRRSGHGRKRGGMYRGGHC